MPQMNSPRHNAAWYIGARSDAPFQVVCEQLQKQFHLPAFEEDREDNWVYGYAENEELGINVTRADDFKTIEKWMPGSPTGINYQFIVYSEEEPDKVLSFIRSQLNSGAILYARKNTEA